MDKIKIQKPDTYESLPESEKLRRRDMRKELHQLISKMCNDDAVVRTNLYNKLYKTFKTKTGIDLSKQAEKVGYPKVVEYAQQYGYIDELLNFAKDLYKNAEVDK